MTITPKQTIEEHFKLDLTAEQIAEIAKQIDAQANLDWETLTKLLANATITNYLKQFIQYQKSNYIYSYRAREYSDKLNYDLSKYDSPSPSNVHSNLRQKFKYLASRINNVSTKTRQQFKIPKATYSDRIDLDYVWFFEAINIEYDIERYYKNGTVLIAPVDQRSTDLILATIDLYKELIAK